MGIDWQIGEGTKEETEVAVARLRSLSSDEEELIHKRSLEALSDIGVLIRSESVLSLLDDSGANVDKKKRIARIPQKAFTRSRFREGLQKLKAYDPSRDRLLCL